MPYNQQAELEYEKDAYMIGHRFVRFLESLPRGLNKILRKTKLFSNKYMQSNQ